MKGRAALISAEILRLEAELLGAVIPIDAPTEIPNELDARAAQKVIDHAPPRRRRRRRRRRATNLSADVQDVNRARAALKHKGMLRP